MSKSRVPSIDRPPATGFRSKMLGTTCFGALIMLTGCTTSTTITPSYSGRVLESKTHRPVAMATVEVVGMEGTGTKTNSRGEFETLPGRLVRPMTGQVTIRVTPSTKYNSVELTTASATEMRRTKQGRLKPYETIGDICLTSPANAIDALLFGSAGASPYPGILGPYPWDKSAQIVVRDKRGRTETYWVDKSGNRIAPPKSRK